MKFRLVEDLDDLLLEYKVAIEPGSELEKNLIYDIEHTDIPYAQLAKKYGLGSSSAIKYIIKRLNLNAVPRLASGSLRRIITPGSELEKAIIHDLVYTDKPYVQISKDYGIEPSVVHNFNRRKNLRPKEIPKKKTHTHVYFNTLEADVSQVCIDKIYAKMKFHPSIYLGEYSVGMMQGMYEYIRDKYLNGRPTTDGILEFYLKIASNEISLNNLIDEMKDQSTPAVKSYSSDFDYRFITVSTDKLSTVDFYSANYSQLAKDVLTFFSRKGASSNDFDIVYKDLKAAAAKVDPKTSDRINRINTYISNNLDKIAHNIYSKKGDIVEPTNYINGIPYETSFDVNSHQDLASYMKQYKGYLLYGFMDKTGDIVYIGISIAASSRGTFYSNESRSLILKAFEDGIIEKLIIFKSNLPIQSRSVNTQLIYALESYFAEQLFNTYPANYPKALNKDKPGQNSSRFLASQRWDDLETYIGEQDRLLSIEEFMLAAEELHIPRGSINTHYPYYKYAENYVAKHDGVLSIKDKQTLYNSLNNSKKSIFWDICSSESECREIVSKNERSEYAVDDWKNYRIKNNLPITEDLDDDIDMEYYV